MSIDSGLIKKIGGGGRYIRDRGFVMGVIWIYV